MTSPDNALDDMQARLLALEMVTSAALNQLAAKDPAMKDLLKQLAEPSELPDSAAVGGADGLEHLQANVARLAGAITARL